MLRVFVVDTYLVGQESIPATFLTKPNGKEERIQHDIFELICESLCMC